MITSLQNSHVKNVIKLSQRKQRDAQQKIVIEGYRGLLAALNNQYPLETLYICPELFLGSNEGTLIKRAEDAGASIIEVAEQPFRKMAERQRPEGLVAVAPRLQRRLTNDLAHRDGLYLIVEGIEKPGNLGTILRSADGAGIRAVILCAPYTDLYHPEVIQSSAGAFFYLSTIVCSNHEALGWCRQHKIAVAAATPAATELYSDAHLRLPLAVAVGSEQLGLSDFWLTAADHLIRLPMLGQGDSLNVATATTVLLYEVVRQNRVASVAS